jgi:hypothetical protein
MALAGPNPGGSYPRIVSLQAFDLAAVPTTMTIEPPVTTRFQDVSGSGLPPDTPFVIYRAGVSAGSGQTDSDGTLVGYSGLSEVPSLFPRSLSLESFDGTLFFTASETQGAYPQSVPLSPAGFLMLEAPQSQTDTIVQGAGFPGACEFELSAVSGGTAVSLGGGSTDSNGTWAFDFGPVPHGQEYVWKGQGACAGRNFSGTNPMGPFPRTMAMTPAPNEVRADGAVLGSCVATRLPPGNVSPPRMPTKVPMALKTRRKASGRRQAAVNAHEAPLLLPAMARSLPSVERRSLCSAATWGSSSSRRNHA